MVSAKSFFSTTPSPLGRATLSKRFAFGVLFGLGGVLTGILLLDFYSDWVWHDNPLWSTLLENVVPTLLAVTVSYAAWELFHRDHAPIYLSEAARYTVLGCIGMILFSGLIAGLHVVQAEINRGLIAYRLVIRLATVGAVAGLWVGHNIARVKQAEQDTHEERDRLKNLIDGLPSPVVHGRFDGDALTILRTSTAFEEVFGGQAEGKNLYEIVVPESEQDVAEELDRKAIEEGLIETEVRRQTTDGVRDFQLRIAQALDSGASETYAIYTDITEQKKRQEELRRKERRYQAAFDDPNILGGLLTPEGRVLDLNQTALHYIDADFEEIKNQPFWLTPWFDGDADTQEDVQEWIRRAAEGEYVDFEIDHSEALGAPLVVTGTLRPVTTESGEVTTLLITGKDITERKTWEKDLRLFKQVIEQANDAILVTEADPIDPPGPQITYVNPAFEEMTGYERDELEGKTPRILQGPQTDREVLDTLRTALENQESWSGETVNYRKDGTPYYLHWSIAPVRDHNGDIEHWMSVQRDVTQEKRQERRLQKREQEVREAQERMELTLKHTGSVVYEIDLETRAVQRHGVFEDFFARGPDELPTWDVFAENVVHPDDQSKFIRFYRRLEEGQEESGTLEYRTRPETGKVRWIRDIVSVEGDEPHVLRGLAQDVTEQKKRTEELLRAKQEAEEASRLKSSMLANMSHEIRTPLTSITGFSEILEENLEGRLERFANRIYQSSQRLQRTLESVLHLSKLEADLEELDREEFSLNAVVDEVVCHLDQKSQEKALTVTKVLPEPPVRGTWNEDAVYRICQNLLENAMKFTPKGGRVEVRVRTEGEDALLEIEDSGIGINPEKLPELFKAFKQESEGLDREYEGTGLGLSIVQRLTEALGGEIKVKTEKDEGTCFTVRLPQFVPSVTAPART